MILSMAFAAMSLDVYGVPVDEINWGWNAYPPTFPNEAYGPLTDVDPDLRGDNQLFDVWCPDGEGPFPCYIYAHGGSFIGGSKILYSHPGKYLPDDDVVFMNINYRLGLGSGPAIQDGLAMVQYVKANAAKYKIDPEKIVLGGNSAGGIMMSQIIYTHQEPGIIGLWSLNPWFQNDYSPARLADYPIPVVQVAYDPYPANNNHSALLAFTHASDNWSLGVTSMFLGGGGGDYTFGYEETYDYNPQLWRDGAWIKNTEGVDTGEAVPTLGEWINEIASPSGEDLDPPTPNPASFSIAPKATSDTAVTMMAIAGSDASRPVEYRFIETSGNPGADNSDWQTTRIYNDTGLTPGMVYSYQVQMRDAVGNLGTASAVAVAKELPGAGTTLFHDTFDTTDTTDLNTGLASRQDAGFLSSTYTEEVGANSSIEGNKLRRTSTGIATLGTNFAIYFQDRPFTWSFDFFAVEETNKWTAIYVKNAVDNARNTSPMQVYFRGDNSSSSLILLQYGTGGSVSALSISSNTLATALGSAFSIHDEHNYAFEVSPTDPGNGTYDFLVDGVAVAEDLPYAFSENTERFIEFRGLHLDARFDNLDIGEARGMYDHVNQTRLQILQTWSKGDSAKELEAQLP
jgi:hypothetical protein